MKAPEHKIVQGHLSNLMWQSFVDHVALIFQECPFSLTPPPPIWVCGHFWIHWHMGQVLSCCLCYNYVFYGNKATTCIQVVSRNPLISGSLGPYLNHKEWAEIVYVTHSNILPFLQRLVKKWSHDPTLANETLFKSTREDFFTKRQDFTRRKSPPVHSFLS